jgi:hypothetical protein
MLINTAYPTALKICIYCHKFNSLFHMPIILNYSNNLIETNVNVHYKIEYSTVKGSLNMYSIRLKFLSFSKNRL